MTQAIQMPVHVTPGSLDVQPGSKATISVSVFNTTDIIDSFTVAIVGADRTWVTSQPDEARLFPDKADAVQLTVEIPQGFPAGDHTVYVQVTSQTTGEAVAVAPVTLKVAKLPAFTAELDPELVAGGRRGRFGLILTNTGNVEIDIRLTADDKTNELNYKLTPDHLLLPPGETNLSQVVATGSRPLTGVPLARPFVLTATAGDLEYELQATLVSDPWIPRWLLTFFSIAMLLGLWAFVVGLAIDAIMEDSNDDLTNAFAEGIESVVEAIDPDALTDPVLGTGRNASAALAAAAVVRGAAGTFTGTVATGVDKKAIPGATVLAIPLVEAGSRAGMIDTSRDPAEAVVAEDGTFVFEDMVEGSYILLASAPGYETPALPGPDEVYECPPPGAPGPPCLQVPIAAGTEPFTFALAGKLGLISGVVTSSDGTPQPGVVVQVNRLVDQDGMNPSIESVAVMATLTKDDGGADLDLAGRFAFDDLATPAEYELVLTTGEFITQRLVVPLEAGQRVVDLIIPMVTPGFGKVQGRVTDRATGFPLGGVAVEIGSNEGAAGIVSTTQTVAEGSGIGSFMVAGLANGDYTATFRKDGYEDVALPIKIESETVVEVNPEMSPAPGPDGAPIGSVTGRVTDSLTQQGLGGVSVVVSGPSGSFVTSTLSSGAGGQAVGSYSVSGLPIGIYTASYSAAYYQPAALPFSITADDTTASVSAGLDVIPTPVTGTLRVVTGTADSTALKPLAGQRLLYVTPTRTIELGTTDATGAFAVAVPATPGIQSITPVDKFLVPTIDVPIDPGTAVDVGEIVLIRMFDQGSLVDQFDRSLDAPGVLDPDVLGEVSVTITNVDIPDNRFTLDLATFEIDPFSISLPGPATYSFLVTMPVGAQRFQSTVTLDTQAVDGINPVDFTVPFAPGVLWGTLEVTAGTPLATASVKLIRLADDGTGGIVALVDDVATDEDGRVFAGPVPEVGIYTFRYDGSAGDQRRRCGDPITVDRVDVSIAFGTLVCAM